MSNNWKNRSTVGTFEELVAMYINDCIQYLEAAKGGRPVNTADEAFRRTRDRDEIYDGLRDLKDYCMRAAGMTPLDWSKTRMRKK